MRRASLLTVFYLANTIQTFSYHTTAIFAPRTTVHFHSTNKSFRKILLKNQKHVPILYTPREQNAKISKMRLSIEHVVPVSTIKQFNMSALTDAKNIFLANATINNLRSNFTMALILYPHKNRENILNLTATRQNVRHIINDIYIDPINRLFFPGFEDIPLIARTILHMHQKWGIPLGAMTINSMEELRAIDRMFPASKQEQKQKSLLKV